MSDLTVNGTIYADNPVSDYVALLMTPADGNKTTRIQTSGDLQVVHSEIVFEQVAPTGTGSPTDSRIKLRTMDGGTLADRLTVTEDAKVNIGSPGASPARLNVGGGLHLQAPQDEFEAISMRPNDGNKFSKIRALGDSAIVHTQLLFKQVAPTGAGNPTDSALEVQTMNAGSLATRLMIDGDGKVGIGNTAPGDTLDVSGKLRVRGVSTVATFTNPGDIALKSTTTPRLSFHKDDGALMAELTANGNWLSAIVGEEEDEDDKQFNVIVKGQHFLQVHSNGFVGMGPLDAGFNPTLGPLHVYADGHHRFIVSDPVYNIGNTPVVIVDESGPLEGVSWGFTGIAMIKAYGTGPFVGAFISVMKGQTQTITIDANRTFTFEVPNSPAQLLGYQSAGNDAYDVMVFGMYR